MISEDAYKELEEALGPENVSREPAVLDCYAWQAFTEVVGETSGWCPNRPAAVALPGSTAEVQAVVRICGKHSLQFKAMCTGWGVWNMVGGEDVVQLDLRRMDRILEIDEKNMYAVVEPYAIGAQLQAEAMKLGLNCHIIGAGSGTSPLASATSLCGYGWSGLTTSYSARTLMATEWVLPDGELLRIGTVGSGPEWFCGDGPGPSLRGIARGYIGNCGGLGVFTACALKLFPWPGPPEPVVEGTLLDPERAGVPIDRMDRAGRSQQVGEGESERAFARAEVGPCQAARCDSLPDQPNVIAVIHATTPQAPEGTARGHEQ